MTPVWALSALAWLLLAGAGIAALGHVRIWRRGRAATVDWRAGLAALPRRYLHDVHAVVARRPRAARMHATVAGGLLAGSVALLPGIVPALSESPAYRALVAACFALALAGAALVAARRLPATPSTLSRGRFVALPAWIAAYATGALLFAAGLRAPGLLLAALGGLGLLDQFARGPMRHALAGATWLVAHSRPERFRGRSTGLKPLDLDAPRLGPAASADFAWNRLAAFDACIQCGRCEEACPAFAAGQPLNPKKLIQDLAGAARGDTSHYAGSPYPGRSRETGPAGPHLPIVDGTIPAETLWACTTCRACVEECPMMIEHVDAIVDLRRHETMERGAVPAGAIRPLTESRLADEPGGRPLAARTDFAAGLPLPVLGEGGETDVLLWLGEGAYDQRHGRSLRALIRLMAKAGLSYAVLGAAERDCGDLARRLGDEATFQALARANVATLATRRFRRIVTADPHALHVLRHEYPAFGGRYEVIHHSALLDELAAADRLGPIGVAAGRVTYHDPCYLARYNGETEAPRRLLARIAAEPVEMARHGLRSHCCGGGGGAPVSDIAGERRIPDMRMAQAAETGAAVVAVACPGCTAMLEGVVGPAPVVRDLAELVLDAVERAA